MVMALKVSHHQTVSLSSQWLKPLRAMIRSRDLPDSLAEEEFDRPALAFFDVGVLLLLLLLFEAPVARERTPEEDSVIFCL